MKRIRMLMSRALWLDYAEISDSPIISRKIDHHVWIDNFYKLKMIKITNGIVANIKPIQYENEND